MKTGSYAEIIPEYYKHMRLLIVEAILLGDVPLGGMNQVTTKSMYQG